MHAWWNICNIAIFCFAFFVHEYFYAENIALAIEINVISFWLYAKEFILGMYKASTILLKSCNFVSGITDRVKMFFLGIQRTRIERKERCNRIQWSQIEGLLPVQGQLFCFGFFSHQSDVILCVLFIRRNVIRVVRLLFYRATVKIHFIFKEKFNFECERWASDFDHQSLITKVTKTWRNL